MNFNHIGIIGKQDRPEIRKTVEQLIEYLTHKGIRFSLSNETLPKHKSKHLSQDDLAQASDLLIVIGGDGSLLSAARIAVIHDTPILGINKGCLGFLTDITPNELESKLAAILKGDYIEGARFFLETSITDQNGKTTRGIALNEIVLSPGKTPHMIEFALHVDGEFMYSQRSDGMIFSTPTGSTAYALSAGGPIVHPKLNAITLIPIFPHALTNRPILIDGDSTIEIALSPETVITPQLICDSQTSLTLTKKSKIIIKKFEKELRLIHPIDYNYFDALHSKLHWERKLPCEE